MILKQMLWHFYNVHLHLERFADRLNAYSQWSKPVGKVRGHVSGDALTQWRYEGMPLPNIWEDK